ncbi:universal stress protein [Aeromicrobium sp. Leaf350]|uniref:universal stress protein n=1 Tax=Aeromicrobium sp. Leaf350 TaxID=2876565 RepID=UPI001E651C61|nr:universal stress protein [Aeromicrobium sp. Leaf350]
MTVVVAWSADEYGAAALAHGAAQAEQKHEDLVVVNVTRGDAYVDRRYAADEEIARVTAAVKGLGLEVRVVHGVVDDVPTAVVDEIRTTRASLAVVGIRHRSPVGKMLLGSVAQRIILDAPCPVLAVKPDPEADLI